MTFPDGTDGGALLHDSMALLVETARLSAGGGEAAALTMFHDRLGDPVDDRIVADGGVHGVDEDDLEVLVLRVLIHPVRIQHAQVPASATHALFRDRALVARELQLRHTLVRWLTVLDALHDRTLATATANTH